MKRLRHTPEQIVRKLRQADSELAKGTIVAEICKALGVSENTYHRWRNQFGGIKADFVPPLVRRRPLRSGRSPRLVLGHRQGGCRR